MVKKNKLREFLLSLSLNKYQQINFWLIILIFLLMPFPNYYTELEIIPGEPLVRLLDIKLPEISSYPVNATKKNPPLLSALSAIVIDVPSKTIIMEKNPNTQLLPASTTKIMTALVSLDYYALNSVLEVKNLDCEGQNMKLVLQEKMTAENLLYGLLVQSGNDSACTLADNYPGGREKFVEAMNEKAKKLHLDKTHYLNPTGVDEANHLTTVHDLAILGSEAIKNPVFSQMISTQEIEVSDTTDEIKHKLKNINELLGKIPGLKGIKTGWTESAQECLVSYVKRDDKEIITVVLGSQDRFGETTQLINWVFTNFKWEATPSIPL